MNSINKLVRKNTVFSHSEQASFVSIRTNSTIYHHKKFFSRKKPLHLQPELINRRRVRHKINMLCL